MGSDIEEKVIKPPIKQVTSGKIFKPSKAFLHKMLLQPVVVATTIWLIIILGFIGMSFLVASSDPSKYPSAIQHINTYIGAVNFWTIIVNLVWLIPVLVFVPFYFRSIEYSVKAESGETMPEIYVKQGVITVTRKHVPFRTITNISSKAGLFDRLLGIGSVHIETAGYSGSNQRGPEVKLEGIVFYEEVRDFILNELRKFKSPYVTGTEVVRPIEEPVPRMEGLDDEILITLREIRDLLRSQKIRK
ncbi:MAG: PH domain-containing protein [Candidatus Bathyarchaeota archaeon]|nr:PH domain-containing protein [Candidatus Bathyarchaeota archaeon]MDH5622872.1 PH domain-containing protein [Candidatus Bathyarchaeota archaeon]MDH5636136.1 PH domain-containing protein [Candidatus Bathyarchaeota archaeon]MDH5702464.1 PH domain-containing protein [Candidatus Bathyarchaeota archaeon]